MTRTGTASTTVSWSSGNDDVAEVSASGVVTAVAVGTTSITATSTFDPTKTDSITVAVTGSGSITAWWTRQFGANGQNSATGVAVDGDGNVIAVGQTQSLQGEPLEPLPADATVWKFDADGGLVWTHQFASDEEERATAVAVDASDDSIIVAGYTEDLIRETIVTSTDAFVRKLSSDGNEVWTHQFGSRSLNEATAVAVDASGNVLVTGHAQGTFGEYVPMGDRDAFVMKSDPNGSRLWTHEFGTAVSDQTGGIATDAAGGVIVAGTTDGVLAWESRSGLVDAFVTKFGP